MHADLDADAAALGAGEGELFVDGPAITAEVSAGFDHHVADKLALFHEGRAECLGAGPGLRTPTVEVDATAVGRDEGGCPCELEGYVGSELDDCGWLHAF